MVGLFLMTRSGLRSAIAGFVQASRKPPPVPYFPPPDVPRDFDTRHVFPESDQREIVTLPDRKLYDLAMVCRDERWYVSIVWSLQ
jgi:hypothetical protein